MLGSKLRLHSRHGPAQEGPAAGSSDRCGEAGIGRTQKSRDASVFDEEKLASMGYILFE